MISFLTEELSPNLCQSQALSEAKKTVLRAGVLKESKFRFSYMAPTGHLVSDSEVHICRGALLPERLALLAPDNFYRTVERQGTLA